MNDFYLEPTRHEFLHMPHWQKYLFYVLIYISLSIMFAQFFWRFKLWKQGKSITWKPEIVKNFITYVLAQKKVRSSRKTTGAPMHLMIFYGFLTLFIATTLLAISTYGPWNFHRGLYYLIYEMIVDIMGLVYVVGIVWAIARRNVKPPASLTHAISDNWALLLLLSLGISGFILEAARMNNNPQPFDWSGIVGFALSKCLWSISDSMYVAIWWIHAVLVYAFFITLPQMRLKHILMAVITTATKPDTHMGALKPITMEEVEQTGKIGVTDYQDYSKWHLMSLDACMECGRCTEVCPANGVGKVLNPKQIVQGIRVSMESGVTVADAVTEEALWECTTCNACVEACPVLIRHVDLIVDARRGLVAEGKLAGSAAVMLRQTGSTSNAWGASPEVREDWMKDVEVPLAREKKEFDVLFWVGCAGATDSGAMKTTKAMASLLDKAGVDYACLGREESCTGDSARRAGDEFLYQQMVAQNLETFKQYKFKKIVTPCPHCFNTLKNEYNDFYQENAYEGNHDVIHHTQYIQELISDGKLQSAKLEDKKVTYHDPCYLARVNNESDAPRKIVGDNSDFNSGGGAGKDGKLAEPENKGRKTLCCGAGGGRMWMEEPPSQRPGNKRAEELIATGAKDIAVGCPFCRIMIGDSVKQVTEDNINILDLAELVDKANE